MLSQSVSVQEKMFDYYVIDSLYLSQNYDFDYCNY